MLVFDAHSDILNDITDKQKNLEKDIIKKYHIDKYKKGQVMGSIFVVWVEPDYSNDYLGRTLAILDAASIEFNNNKDIIKVIKNKEDIDMAIKDQKMAVMIGMEGLASLDENIDYLQTLYKYGVRHASLTWNEENKLATGSKGNVNRGITPLGKEAIKTMEKLGIILDVSHINEKSFWDVCDTVTKPFVASHSNVYSLCNNIRNLKDDQIKAIAQSGGVIGINAWPDFVDEKRPSLEKLTRHIDYVVDLVGIDHIGFGFDFTDFLDEAAVTTFASVTNMNEFNNISQVQMLTNLLKEKGYSEEHIEKIAYKNFVRVIKEIIG